MPAFLLSQHSYSFDLYLTALVSCPSLRTVHIEVCFTANSAADVTNVCRDHMFEQGQKPNPHHPLY